MSVIRRPAELVLLATLGVSLAVAGCIQAEPTALGSAEERKAVCDYWPAKLSIPSKEERAFKLIAEAKCKNALPELEKMFENRSHRSKVLKCVRAIGDRSGSVPILKRALGDSRLAKQAATLVGRWKIKSLVPQLLGILESEGREGDRLAALDALLEMTDPAMHEDLLIKLAWTDLNVQNAKVNARAIRALQGMKSKKAGPYLVVAAFLQGDGQSVYQVARQALAALGKDAVGPLAKASQDKLEILKKVAGKARIPHWEWTTGQKIAQLLADTLHEDAAIPLAKNFALSIGAMPIGVAGSPKEPLWIINQKNRLNIAHFGLGHIGSDAPAAVLEKLVRDESADTIRQRLKAARSLAYIGTTKALATLFRLWDTDSLYNPDAAADLKAGKKAQKKKKKKSKKKKGKGGNALFLGPLTLPLALAVGPRELAAFDERMKAAGTMRCWTREGSKGRLCVQAYLKDPEVQSYLVGVRACKESVDCYLKELSNENKFRVIKAALILARGLSKGKVVGNGLIGDKDAVIQALLARVKTTPSTFDASVRNIVAWFLPCFAPKRSIRGRS